MMEPKLKEKLNALLLDLRGYVDERAGQDEFEGTEEQLLERLDKMIRYINKIPRIGDPTEEPFKIGMVPKPSMNESVEKLKKEFKRHI